MDKNSTSEHLNNELRQKILKLTASQRKFEELFDLLPQIVVETDLKGNLTYANNKENGQTNGLRSIIVDITERKKKELVKEVLIEKLQKAISEIKTLRGIIPICSHCKKIRDDKGYYQQVETYVSRHTEAEFSHGLCPECEKKYYPKYYARQKK